ncbi:MAG: hypothetical protein ACTSYA_10380 [Candidatus Kariarchaeaceae archaeon]|nr:MAG: hypothetical protein DRO61_11305 [Candidatus Bathyarchaeota archaeon]
MNPGVKILDGLLSQGLFTMAEVEEWVTSKRDQKFVDPIDLEIKRELLRNHFEPKKRELRKVG